MCITNEKQLKKLTSTKTNMPMKTTNFFRTGILLIALVVFALTGCKKDNTSQPTVNTSSLQQLSKDEERVTQASDEALNDANTVLSGVQLKSTENFWPCNATIDSATVAGDSITFHINYHGLNCAGTRFRTGTVEVTKKIGQQWGEPGATTIVKLIDFTITKVTSGKSLTLNGRKVFTNVSGGYMWQLGNTITSIVHHVTGTLTATFDDNTTRIWHIDRQRTFTGIIGELVMTLDGLGSADGYTGLVVWGINRNGEAFYTQITQPIVNKATCDWDPVSGIKIHEIPGDVKKATITYGYDSNYQLITNGDCPTYYRVDWQKGANSGTFYVPLP
jgi:hypothetical protein